MSNSVLKAKAQGFPKYVAIRCHKASQCLPEICRRLVGLRPAPWRPTSTNVWKLKDKHHRHYRMRVGCSWTKLDQIGCFRSLEPTMNKMNIKFSQDLRGFWLGHRHRRAALPSIAANCLAIAAPRAVESSAGTNWRCSCVGPGDDGDMTTLNSFLKVILWFLIITPQHNKKNPTVVYAF